MVTNWTPELSSDGPRYRALADAIAEAIDAGALTPGAKLPPVRDLSWRLGVTPGTVARAYRLAEDRRLVEARVGSGTFVRPPGDPQPRPDLVTSPAPIASPPRGAPSAVGMETGPNAAATPDGVFDMRGNRAADIGQDALITAALERLIARHGALPLTRYHRYGEDAAEREAGAQWLRSGGAPARAEDVIVCSGAQQGLLTTLAATCGGRDAVALSEPLIHPGLKDCARGLDVRLEPVATDEHGLVPEALEAACRQHRPSAIILTANNQNPTLATMPVARREAIAEIARARRTPIIEDDVYGWLIERRAPSFPSLCPELSWYVTSFSKCVAAGLRVGYILAPTGEGPRGARILQGYSQHVSWLLSALGAELATSGDAARIVEAVRQETAARSALLAEIMRPALGEGRLSLSPTSSMAWLELPAPWRAAEFAEAARRAGVFVASAETFAVGRTQAPHAVRIAFGDAADRAALATAAERLAAVLLDGPMVQAIQDLGG